MMARNSHRGRYANKFKQQVVAETFEPGASVAAVARKHDLNGNMLFGWRKDPRFVPAARDLASFLPVEVQAADVALAPSPPSRIVLDVALASGHRLHFTNGVEHSVLVALLRDLSA